METLFAVISGHGLLTALFYIVAAGVLFYVLNWMIAYVKLGPPFDVVARVVVACVVAFFLIAAILAVAGHPVIAWP